MTKTIAIVNEKGGTGKTTTAVNLSAALGELGQRVLLVDLDGQAASSRWLGVEDDTRFADALWKGEAFEPILDVIPGVSLAPGSGKLDSVAHDLRPTQGGQLRKVLSLLSGFDHVIIDCPPSLGNRLIGNAMLAATHAIVPVEVSILALDGLRILLTTFQDVRDGFGHEIALAGVLACRYDARTRLSRFVLSELHRALPGKVFRTVIRENIRMRECPGSGQSILAYAPDSHAAEDYRALAQEVLAGKAASTGSGQAAGDPALAADGAGAEGELTEKECQAILEMRGQITALLHGTGPKAATGAEAPAPCEPAMEQGPAEAAISGEPPGPSVTEEPVGPTVSDEPVGPAVSEEMVGAEAVEGVPTRPAPAEPAPAEPLAEEPAPAEPAPAAPLAEEPAPAAPWAEEPLPAAPPAPQEVEAPAIEEVEAPPEEVFAPQAAVDGEEAATPAALRFPLGVDVEARGPKAHLDRVQEEPEEPPAEDTLGPDAEAAFARKSLPGPEGEDPPAAEAPKGLDALRAVLQSLQTAKGHGRTAHEVKKESVFRKLFSKRSA